jgi:hypothetical protein
MKNEKSNAVDANVEEHFLVIHPLDDVHEQKMDPTRLGVMKMTPAVRISLVTLRAYLVLMLLMLLCYVLDLAGIWKIKFF